MKKTSVQKANPAKAQLSENLRQRFYTGAVNGIGTGALLLLALWLGWQYVPIAGKIVVGILAGICICMGIIMLVAARR